MADINWLGQGQQAIADLRRRAFIIQHGQGLQLWKLGTWDVYGWEDGAGNWATFFFIPDGRVLLLTFDHESRLNLFSEYEKEAQEQMYQGVPADLIAGLHLLDESGLFLVTLEGEPDSLPFASGVFWYDGAQWHIADGLQKLLEDRDLELYEATGLGYCTNVYLFDDDFTLEDLIAQEGSSATPDEEQLRLAFAAADAAGL